MRSLLRLEPFSYLRVYPQPAKNVNPLLGIKMRDFWKLKLLEYMRQARATP
jgi:hypothetical protein